MTRDTLTQSARKLPVPERKAANEFSEKKDALAEKINTIFQARDDIENLIGKNNLDMMRDNHRNHARFIEYMMFEFSPELLVETVLWVFRAYRSHGFSLSYWPAQLDTWVEIFKEELSKETFDAVYPMYNWMIVNQPVFTRLSDSAIGENPASTVVCI